MGVATVGAPSQPVQRKRPAHCLWAALLDRIYEVLRGVARCCRLLCPVYGGQMRVIAFITHSANICHILDHIGVEPEPPRITLARGPPLWGGCDAPMGDGVEVEPDWHAAAQPAPGFEVDQRVSW
jgi:hypothetical protein